MINPSHPIYIAKKSIMIWTVDVNFVEFRAVHASSRNICSKIGSIMKTRWLKERVI